MTRTFARTADRIRATREQARATTLVSKTETPAQRRTAAARRVKEYDAAMELLKQLEGQLYALGQATLKSSCERTGLAPEIDPTTEDGQLVNRVEDAGCVNFYFDGLRQSLSTLQAADRRSA